MPGVISTSDDVRRAMGFLSVEATAGLIGRGVLILDPASTLISPNAVLASDVVLWPGVVIDADAAGNIEISAEVILHAGSRIVARSAQVRIAEQAEIGEEGGFTICADAGVTIVIGARARLMGGGSLSLDNSIGRGAQIIGAIRAQNCRLGDGESHRDPDPDRRGGVLKGLGVARGLDVPAGHVVQAFGIFADAPLRRQSEFHPRP